MKNEYVFTDNTQNPYEHYNTAESGVLGKKDRYLFKENIGNWKDKDLIVTQADEPYLNQFTSKKSIYKQVDNIPGCKNIYLYYNHSDDEVIKSTYNNKIIFCENKTLYNIIFNDIFKEYLDYYAREEKEAPKLDWGDFLIYDLKTVWTDENTGEEVECPINQKPFAIKSCYVVAINSDKFAYASDYFIDFNFPLEIPAKQAFYFSIQKDMKTEFEKVYPPEEYEYSVEGKYFVSKRKIADDIYDVNIRCKSSPGSHFVLFVFGIGYSEEEINAPVE